MKLSKPIAFGLRALLAIAKEPDKLHSVRLLTEKEGLPETLTRRCLMRLKEAGFLVAERGRMGGYKLAKAPKEISIASVIRALEEDLNLSLGQGRRKDALYEPGKTCPTAPFWNRMEKKFWKLLEEATLADLVSS
ncbi:MAG: Rrf2 family transcriptional regulator [Candidatus Bipolaricaulaceae bacterium]